MKKLDRRVSLIPHYSSSRNHTSSRLHALDILLRGRIRPLNFSSHSFLWHKRHLFAENTRTVPVGSLDSRLVPGELLSLRSCSVLVKCLVEACRDDDHVCGNERHCSLQRGEKEASVSCSIIVAIFAI